MPAFPLSCLFTNAVPGEDERERRSAGGGDENAADDPVRRKIDGGKPHAARRRARPLTFRGKKSKSVFCVGGTRNNLT